VVVLPALLRPQSYRGTRHTNTYYSSSMCREETMGPAAHFATPPLRAPHTHTHTHTHTRTYVHTHTNTHTHTRTQGHLEVQVASFVSSKNSATTDGINGKSAAQFSLQGHIPAQGSLTQLLNPPCS